MTPTLIIPDVIAPADRRDMEHLVMQAARTHKASWRDAALCVILNGQRATARKHHDLIIETAHRYDWPILRSGENAFHRLIGDRMAVHP